MKNRTKFLLVLSLIVMLTTLFAISVSAQTPVETWDISATSSDSVTAYLYNDTENSGYYNLTVSGTGNMKGWTFYNAPWYSTYGSKIKSVVINNGVTNIGKCAFYCCTGLESVTIPESVTSIGNETFYKCTALTEINFNATSLANFAAGNNVFYNAGKNGNGIKVKIGKNVAKIPERLFCPDSYDATYSPKLINVIFEENSVCTSIGRSAFNRCESLTSINLPSTIKSIEMYAFLNCSSLKSITIPKSTASIANEAFNGCTALTRINFNANSMADLETGNNVFYNAGKNGNGITVTIGKNVTKIPARLLCPYSHSTAYAPKVTKVIFEENSVCTSIRQSAFNQCYYLTSINIPNSVTSIGAYAFQNNYALTSITIPQGTTSIGEYAFYSCHALTEIRYNATSISKLAEANLVFGYAGINAEGITVYIGNNVTRIPAEMFCPNCQSEAVSPNIIKVIFEENSQCTSIGECAFNQCFNLSSINIPNTVTSISAYAFQNNYALTSIIIPKELTSLGNNAFKSCNALTIYAEASNKSSGWQTNWNSTKCPVVWDYKNTIKNDVFTFKGYSFNESGSMAYGYDIDYEAKVLYEELTGDILEMGVVFAAYDNLGGNQPLDENGQEVTISIGKVVKANINSYEYTYYDFILTDIDDSIKDVKFVISAYLYDGEAVKYVQENSLSNTVTGKSYNEAKESVAQ